MDVVGAGMNAYGSYNEYKAAREHGDSAPVSVAKAAGSLVLGEVLGMPQMMAYMGVTMGVKAIHQTSKYNTEQMQKAYSQKGGFGSGYMPMTNAGATMRQRSLSAMQQNAGNISNVFGNEARTYFRSAGY